MGNTTPTTQMPHTITRYTRLSAWLKARYGAPTYRVALDPGLSCPNRDGTIGTGGCAFCNNDAFGPPRDTRLPPVHHQLTHGIARLRARREITQFIAYLQPYSNTHTNPQKLDRICREAVAHPDVVALSISTRPDCVDEQKLDILANIADSYDVDVTLEYGLQTCNDTVLNHMQRGHGVPAFVRAVSLTSARHLMTCAHVIIGLPGDTPESVPRTSDLLAEHNVNGVKLHNFHVVRGTTLGRDYEQQPFALLSRHAYVQAVCEFLEHLPASTVIHRLSGQARPEYHIAPAWALDKSSIQHDIEHLLEQNNTWQGRLAGSLHPADYLKTVRVKTRTQPHIGT